MIPELFRRRARQAERWEPGDVAECVVRTPWYRKGRPSKHPGPVFGERYVVDHISVGRSGRDYLGFARFLPRVYLATAFRKVRPQADAAIAADSAFVARLRGRELVQ